jgi:membrane protein
VSTAARVRELVRDVARATRGHDLALYAAGVTFYAAIGVVPLLLLALYLAGLLAGQATVQAMAEPLAMMIPDGLGAQQATRFLADAGTGLTPLHALAALVAASLYGEGMVRGFDRLSVHGSAGRRSLRGRLGALVAVAVSPLLLLAGLAVTHQLTRRLGDGLGSQLLGVYVAFLAGWFAISLLLALGYSSLSAERHRPRSLAWASLTTGSFLSGTCLGFLLFLELDLDLGGAYGGAQSLAVAVACLGWLWVLHVMVLVGYVLMLSIDRRDGRPLREPVSDSAVRRAA